MAVTDADERIDVGRAAVRARRGLWHARDHDRRQRRALRDDGTLLVNELAPRPHNSGHGTLDASRTSQFEQQVRTLAGLPLGDTTMCSPVVTQNLLGDLWHGGTPPWQALLADSAATLHLYGKAEPRSGRKMGHFSCIAPTVDEALVAALRLRRLFPSSRAAHRGSRSGGQAVERQSDLGFGAP